MSLLLFVHLYYKLFIYIFKPSNIIFSFKLIFEHVTNHAPDFIQKINHQKYTYNIIGDIMYPCRRPGGGLTIILLFILSILIFYQLIITFILPFRWNIFVLLIEIFFFFFLLCRIIWPRC